MATFLEEADREDWLVLLSACTLLIPAMFSIWTQPMLVTLILGNVCLYTILGRIFSDSSYRELEKIWSTVGVLLSLVLLAIIGLHYSPWHWRVFMPFVLGVAAAISYGMIQDPFVTDNDYFRAAWYAFTSLAFMFLIATPTDLSKSVQIRYADVFLSVWNRRDEIPSYLKDT
jgi:glucan phosphoethanolaminetransferase (alkaline phosphatase superfamily)